MCFCSKYQENRTRATHADTKSKVETGLKSSPHPEQLKKKKKKKKERVL